MPLSRSRRTAKFVLDRLRTNVAHQLENQFPVGNDGPRAILSLISGILDTGQAYLDGSLAAGLSPDKAREQISEAMNLSKSAYTLLNALRGTAMEDLPYPVVAPLQRWLNQLLQKQSTAVFRAELAANYELAVVEIDWFMRVQHASAALTKAIKETDWPIRFITLPAKAFGIIPHFAIVAHEIGHALYPRLKTPAAHPLHADQAELEARIKKRLAGKFDAEAQKRLNVIFWKWYEELCADAFMFYLTGPAGFFSLCEVFEVFAASTGYGESHPASALRRAIVHRQLTSAGFGQVFERHAGMPLSEDINSPLLAVPASAAEIERNARATHDVTSAAVIAELHFFMHKVESGIYAEVRRELESISKDAFYSAAQFEFDLTAHLDAILAAIPPVETGDALETRNPTEFASILNVGWVALLAKLDLLRVKVPPPDTLHAAKVDRLHSLLLKAVELSEARRDWENA